MAVENIMIVTGKSQRMISAIVIAPGIAVHEDTQACALKAAPWTITATECGFAIVQGCTDRKHAKMVAKKLARIYDWRKMRKESDIKKIPPQTYKKIVAILDLYVR